MKYNLTFPALFPYDYGTVVTSHHQKVSKLPTKWTEDVRKATEKATAKYRWDQDTEVVLILMQVQWYVLPRAEERSMLVMQAHKLGHFPVDSTVERLLSCGW